MGLVEQGLELYRRNTPQDNADARKLFEQAIAQEPLSAEAYARLAATHRQDWNHEWTTNDPTELRNIEQRAFEAAQRSVKADPLSPYGHVQLAYLHLYRREYDQAEKEAREAVQLGRTINPGGYSEGDAVLAQVLTYGGEPQIAAALMERAVKLEEDAKRKVPAYYYRQLGQAYYVAGQYERYLKNNAQKAKEYYGKAKETLERAMGVSQTHRQTRLSLAAVYMASGDVQDEQKAKDLFRADQAMGHHITIGQRRQQAPYKDLWIRDLYIDALRRAGS